MNQKTYLSVFLFVFLFQCTAIRSQSPAPAPAPPGPTNITAILEKASQFTMFIRLLKSTQTADRIISELNGTNQGLTVFAPTDSAFANLKTGTLNSFDDEQKSELINFHMLPMFFSVSQFQTASNPLRTQAGGTSDREFPLNITTSGNSVNITTGIVNATVANTIYTDNQLAVYQVDKVLLPLKFFVPPAPASAPAPSKPKKGLRSRASSSGSDDDAPADSSGDTCHIHKVIQAITCAFAAFFLYL